MSAAIGFLAEGPVLEFVGVCEVATEMGTRLEDVEARVVVVPFEGGELERCVVGASAERFVQRARGCVQCEEGRGGCCLRSAVLSLLFASLVRSQ
jgi:hypothetical protein